MTTCFRRLSIFMPLLLGIRCFMCTFAANYRKSLMKRLLLTVCYISFVLGCTAQPLMRDVFAAMPDTVLPLVTKNNRLDCIDYIENKMEARVRNKVNEYVTLEALTSDYARFRTSTAAVMELKLLPTSDSTTVLCMVTTAEAGEKETARYVEDSNIRLLNADWSSLPADSPVSVASVKQARESDGFYATEVADSIHFAVERAQASLKSFRPVRLQLSPQDATLTLSLQTGYLDIREKRALKDVLHPITMRWNGQMFVLQ